MRRLLDGIDGIGERDAEAAKLEERRGRFPRRRSRWFRSAGRSSAASAASRPLALLTPVGRIITAPLLKMIDSSSPSSLIAWSTAPSCGVQVATMHWPTETARRRMLCSSRRTPAAARRRQRADLLGLRPVEQRAILGDDEIEDVERGEHRLQLRQHATGDEDQRALLRLETMQRRERLGADGAVFGKRAVVVAGDCDKTSRRRILRCRSFALCLLISEIPRCRGRCRWSAPPSARRRP